MESPEPAAVQAQLLREAGEDSAPARLEAELDELLRGIDGETRALPELASALARAALASGTALALLSVAGSPSLHSLKYAGAAFGAGVVGTMGISYLGRLASLESRRIRSRWSSVSVLVRRQLASALRPAEGVSV